MATTAIMDHAMEHTTDIMMVGFFYSSVSYELQLSLTTSIKLNSLWMNYEYDSIRSIFVLKNHYKHMYDPPT